MSNHLPLIAITSHRGGSWKSACAAGISLQLARSGISTLLLDPAKSGGLFACDSDEFRSQPGETLKRRRHVELPLTLAHAPDLLTMERPGAKALEVAEQLGAEMALIDLPTVSREELATLLRDVRLVIITAPIDVVSFRSLPPFLEMLKEQRAMPGRFFDVRAALVGTSETIPRVREMQTRIAENLQPILLAGTLPIDTAYGTAISSARFPDSESISPAINKEFASMVEGIAELISPVVIAQK